MSSIIMKIHKHNGSTRVTIPKEIVKARGWQNEQCLKFLDNGDGEVLLTSITQNAKRPTSTADNHGELSAIKT